MRISSLILHQLSRSKFTTGGKYARKHVPLNLRQILSAESAANDGLAYPFLTLAIFLTIDKQLSAAIVHWIVIGILCEPNRTVNHARN